MNWTSCPCPVSIAGNNGIIVAQPISSLVLKHFRREVLSGKREKSPHTRCELARFTTQGQSGPLELKKATSRTRRTPAAFDPIGLRYVDVENHFLSFFAFSPLLDLGTSCSASCLIARWPTPSQVAKCQRASPRPFSTNPRTSPPSLPLSLWRC